MLTRVLRLPANTEGRDWVIGDVHGAYDLVALALRAVQFRPDVDRLICVGDLVDRGEGSARVEQFLQQPYVYAVRGNHDHMVAGIDPDMVVAIATLNYNGTRWLKNVPSDQVARIQKVLGALPYAIEIASAEGLEPTGIVHAQVPQNWSWPDLVEVLSDWPEEDGVFEDVMCSRYKFDSADATPVQGARRIFAGHSISWDGPKILGNTVFADTGAVFHGRIDGGSLSIIDLHATDAEIQGSPMAENFPGLRICPAIPTGECDRLAARVRMAQPRSRFAVSASAGAGVKKETPSDHPSAPQSTPARLRESQR